MFQERDGLRANLDLSRGRWADQMTGWAWLWRLWTWWYTYNGGWNYDATYFGPFPRKFCPSDETGLDMTSIWYYLHLIPQKTHHSWATVDHNKKRKRTVLTVSGKTEPQSPKKSNSNNMDVFHMYYCTFFVVYTVSNYFDPPLFLIQCDQRKFHLDQ